MQFFIAFVIAKKREVEQLAINPDDILEELEKRQPLCQEEE